MMELSRKKINYFVLLICLSGINQVKSQILSNKPILNNIENSNVLLDASTNYSTEAGAANNVGKGIIIPSVDLVNFEFNLSLADGIIFPTYFDGMIVYNNEAGNTLTTGNRPSQSTAVTPGYYYFYNPNGAANGNVTEGEWRPMASFEQKDRTPFVLSGTTDDAGDNKTEAIGREGSIGVGTTTPENGAVLDVSSEDKGLLVPRVKNIAAVASPSNGMMVYDKSSSCFKLYENGSWTECLSAALQQTVKADCNTGGFQGCLYTGTSASGVTYKVVLVNNTFQSVTIGGITKANLVVSGVAGVTVSAVNVSSVTIPAGGGTATLIFTLAGTPTSSGTLTGTFTKGILSCSNITSISSSPTVAISNNPPTLPVGCTFTFTSTNSATTWISNNPAVAIIDPATGVVTAKAPGTTVIAATLCGGISSTKTITVVAKTAVITAAGNGTLAVPNGVQGFTAEAYGAGGGGGGHRYSYTDLFGTGHFVSGSGGSGGAYSSKVYTVSSGNISYAVGSGGGGGSIGVNGSIGGNSKITYNNVTITAGGGKVGSGGLGGVASGGDTNLNGFASSGRGGGKAAGPLGGAAQFGTDKNHGVGGYNIGGGGSGAAAGTYWLNPFASLPVKWGGNGASGQVRVTWNCP